MDIQHSDIGCNKHQTIPAFQPVHGQQFMKKMRQWTTVFVKKMVESYNVALYKEQSCMQNFF